MFFGSLSFIHSFIFQQKTSQKAWRCKQDVYISHCLLTRVMAPICFQLVFSLFCDHQKKRINQLIFTEMLFFPFVQRCIVVALLFHLDLFCALSRDWCTPQFISKTFFYSICTYIQYVKRSVTASTQKKLLESNTLWFMCHRGVNRLGKLFHTFIQWQDAWSEFWHK